MPDFKACPHCNALYSASASTCQACGKEFSAPVTPQGDASPSPAPPPTPTATGHLYVHQWQTASCPFVVPPHILPGTAEGYFVDEVTRQYKKRLARHTFFTNALIMAFCPLIGLGFIAPLVAVPLFIGILVGVVITYKQKKALWEQVADRGMEPVQWAASLEANAHRPVQIAVMVFIGLAVSAAIGLVLMGFFGTVPGGGGGGFPGGDLRVEFPSFRSSEPIPAVRIPARGGTGSTPPLGKPVPPGTGRRRQQ